MVRKTYVSFSAPVLGVPLALFKIRTLLRVLRPGDGLTAEEQAGWTDRGL